MFMIWKDSSKSLIFTSRLSHSFSQSGKLPFWHGFSRAALATQRGSRLPTEIFHISFFTTFLSFSHLIVSFIAFLSFSHLIVSCIAFLSLPFSHYWRCSWREQWWTAQIFWGISFVILFVGFGCLHLNAMQENHTIVLLLSLSLSCNLQQANKWCIYHVMFLKMAWALNLGQSKIPRSQ